MRHSSRLLNAAEVKPEAAASERVLARLASLPPQGRRMPIRTVLFEWFGVGAGGALVAASRDPGRRFGHRCSYRPERRTAPIGGSGSRSGFIQHRL
jgi:hypothetical protein